MERGGTEEKDQMMVKGLIWECERWSDGIGYPVPTQEREVIVMRMKHIAATANLIM